MLVDFGQSLERKNKSEEFYEINGWSIIDNC